MCRSELFVANFSAIVDAPYRLFIEPANIKLLYIAIPKRVSIKNETIEYFDYELSVYKFVKVNIQYYYTTDMRVFMCYSICTV